MFEKKQNSEPVGVFPSLDEAEASYPSYPAEPEPGKFYVMPDHEGKKRVYWIYPGRTDDGAQSVYQDGQRCRIVLGNDIDFMNIWFISFVEMLDHTGHKHVHGQIVLHEGYEPVLKNSIKTPTFLHIKGIEDLEGFMIDFNDLQVDTENLVEYGTNSVAEFYSSDSVLLTKEKREPKAPKQEKTDEKDSNQEVHTSN